MKATNKAVKRARPTLTEVKALLHELARKSFNLEQLAAALGESKETLAAVEKLASTDIEALRKTLQQAEARLLSQHETIETLRREQSECKTNLATSTAMILQREQRIANLNREINDALFQITALKNDLASARQKLTALERHSWASRLLKRWR